MRQQLQRVTRRITPRARSQPIGSSVIQIPRTPHTSPRLNARSCDAGRISLIHQYFITCRSLSARRSSNSLPTLRGARASFGNLGGTPGPTGWAWRESERVDHVRSVLHALSSAQGRATRGQLHDHAIKCACTHSDSSFCLS